MSFGSLLEWYEIFLYIYWAPVISHLFFKASSDSTRLLNSLFIFMVGFWARPIGGIVFGRLGDLVGRKYSLICSITILIFPTLGIGLLPTYEQIGILAPIILVILRFLQALPSGGELPGAFCYLYECSPPSRRHYITSWGAIGSQLGIAISLLESKFMESMFSPAALSSWGWRVSFIAGSFIALLGLLLRSRLHETPVYRNIERRHQQLKISIFEIFKRYGRSIFMVMTLGLFNSAGFYMLCLALPIYTSTIFRIENNNTLPSLILLILGSVFIPFIGFLGDRFNNKKMLITSIIIAALTLYPLYLAAEHLQSTYAALLLLIFIICLSVSAALLPYCFAIMFPPFIRFTGMGIGFNMGDGVLGSATTVMAFYFLTQYGSLLPCYIIIFICAMISLTALCFVKERNSRT